MAGIIKVNQYQDFNGNTLFTSDGSGNLTTLKTNYPAFEAYLNADTNVSDATWTIVSNTIEAFDTHNYYDTSAYTFTPQVAGRYFVYGSIRHQSSSANTLSSLATAIYFNGSAYKSGNFDPNSTENVASLDVSAIINFNGSTDNVSLYGYNDVSGGTPRFDSGTKSTYFGAYRIGS